MQEKFYTIYIRPDWHLLRTRPMLAVMSDEFAINDQQAGQRLDIFCVSQFPDHSRAALQKAIKEGHITVNGQNVKRRHAIKEGDLVTVPSLAPPREALGRSGDKGNLSIPIIFEDKDLVVVNKPAGVLVHPTSTSHAPTIADWFATKYPNSPGHVHRLDKDTSGLLIMATTAEAYDFLKQEFKQHRVRKEYLALVYGVPGMPDGRINQAITRSQRNPMRRTIVPKKSQDGNQGRLAITEWQAEHKFRKHALLRVFPLTGRTHQIRVHLHHIGHPIVGDPLYVFKRQKPPAGVTRHMLHAAKITFQHPVGGRKALTAPLPEDMQAVIDQL